MQSTRHITVNSPYTINVIAFSSVLSSRQCSGEIRKCGGVSGGSRILGGWFARVSRQCCSHRGKSLSSRILEDQPINQALSSSLFLNHKVLEIFKDFAFYKLSIMYDRNSVTAIVHDQDTVKNVLLT